MITYKPFENCFIVGRFQHIHLGHQQMISMGLHLAKKVLVMVGSSQLVTPTLRNPFSANFRLSLMQDIYKNQIEDGRMILGRLPDMTHEEDITPAWGRWVLEHATDYLRESPDLMIYGRDEERGRWFADEDIVNLTDMRLSRSTIPISATQLRNAIAMRNMEYWKQYTDPSIHHRFEEIRQNLVKLPDYQFPVLA